MSITGDTAKILVLTLQRLCTFTLRPILPREKNETRYFRRREQLYQQDPFPPFATTQSCNKLNPHNLLNQGRAHNAIRLHWKHTKLGRHGNLFVPGWQTTSVLILRSPPHTTKPGV